MCVYVCSTIPQVSFLATWGGLSVSARRARESLVGVGGSVQIQRRHTQQDSFLQVVHHCEAVTVPKRQTRCIQTHSKGAHAHAKHTQRNFHLHGGQGALFIRDSYDLFHQIILPDIQGGTVAQFNTDKLTVALWYNYCQQRPAFISLCYYYCYSPSGLNDQEKLLGSYVFFFFCLFHEK